MSFVKPCPFRDGLETVRSRLANFLQEFPAVEAPSLTRRGGLTAHRTPGGAQAPEHTSRGGRRAEQASAPHPAPDPLLA